MAKTNWEARVKRIHWDNLYVIMVEGNDCSENTLKQFDKFPYRNKVMFTAKRMDIRSAFYIPNSEINGHVMDLCKYKSKFTGRRWLDDFDYVVFNNRQIEM